MGSAPFLDASVGLADHLMDNHRPRFEDGIEARLSNRSHPQGSLLPQGTTRFLQYMDSMRPDVRAPAGGGSMPVTTDLAFALGGFIVHSAIWVRVTQVAQNLLGSDEYTVEVLRWCVQIYDSYDWNLGDTTAIPIPDWAMAGSPPIPREFLVRGNLPEFLNIGGYTFYRLRDDIFRDVEVSGGGHAFLIYSEPFSAPSSVTGPFTVSP
jgi:hypothetical protein